jgi:ubiquinone/menaquinone biosynthesis C-methylase UbiE
MEIVGNQKISKWIDAQMSRNTNHWDSALTTFYPESQRWMSSGANYYRHITGECNYLNAVISLSWDKYLTANSIILDVGCGGGWLSAYLSKNDRVKKIYSIDSSANYLENFLPESIRLSNGKSEKIEACQGLFSPLILDSSSVDLIVISSALHHADNIGDVLSDFYRVLKPGGYLLILNETPLGSIEYLFQISKAFLKIAVQSMLQRYSPYVQKISAGGFLNDPYLGDVDYPDWYWQKAILDNNFQLIDCIDSGMATIIGSSGRTLKHFICQKNSI